MKQLFTILFILISSIIIFNWDITAKSSYVHNDYYPYIHDDQDTTKTGTSIKAGSKEYVDSMRAARKRYTDSMLAENKRVNDSTKAAQIQYRDSLNTEQKRQNDSIRAKMDIERAERQRVLDSSKVANQKRIDSVRTLNEYKQSKVYKDSVAAARQVAKDSVIAIRKAYNDSLKAVQKAQLDSSMAVRKLEADSLKAEIDKQRLVTKAFQDSMKVVREVRADSLNKLRIEREQKSATRVKEKEKKRKLSLELKISKEQDAYTNEKMLKKKWGFVRKVFHNTTTRYNYYYNAQLKMNEANKNMLNTKIDNYDSLLTLFPFDPSLNPTQFLGDMDTIIKRVSVGIQLHDPRGDWQDELYLLVGQAYYYKADYANAAAAFKYIINSAERKKQEDAKKKKGYNSRKTKNEPLSLINEEFTGITNMFKHNSAKNEAVYWLARTFAQENRLDLAQTILNMAKSSKDFTEEMKGRLAVEQAFINIKNKDFESAKEALATLGAATDNPKWLRQRGNYIDGQILKEDKETKASTEAFAQVVDLNPSLEMEFHAKKNMIENSIASGEGNQYIKMLDKMGSEVKYRAYYDQIYFAKARIYEQNKDTIVKIKEAYAKSIQMSQNNPNQKAISYAALADYLNKENKYNLAKLNYDSALAILNPAKQPLYDEIKQKSFTLSKVADFGEIIAYNDSLLNLSKMDEKGQRAVVRAYIKEIDRQQKDSTFAANNQMPNAQPTPLNINNNTSSFYFDNPTNVQKGAAIFKQKWGNRTLSDNWNIRKSNMGGANSNNGNDDDLDENQSTLPSEEDILALIPNTPEQIAKVEQQLKESLFNIGRAYTVDVEDYAQALKSFDRLDNQFPNHEYKDQVLYYRYIIALRTQNLEQADQYKKDLIRNYPNSQYSKQLIENANPSNNGNTAMSIDYQPITDLYDATVELLNNRKYTEALNNISIAEKNYSTSIGKFKKQFDLIFAISKAGLGETKLADSLLSNFIVLNPSGALSDWAKRVAEYLRQNAGAVNSNTLSNTNTGIGQVINNVATSYEYKPQNLHYVIISAKNEDQRFTALKSGIVSYNNTQANSSPKTTSFTPISNNSNLIVIKEFTNNEAAKNYIKKLKTVNALYKEYNGRLDDLEFITISNDNIIKLFTDRDWNKYLQFYKNNYK